MLDKLMSRIYLIILTTIAVYLAFSAAVVLNLPGLLISSGFVLKLSSAERVN